jgi:hypothetical protein
MIILKVISEWMIEKTSLGKDASQAWNDIGSNWGPLDQKLLHSTENQMHDNDSSVPSDTKLIFTL